MANVVQKLTPQPPVETRPSSGITSANQLRHAVQGRRLQVCIQDALYGVSVGPAMSDEWGQAMVVDYLQQAQAWYMSSPLKVAFIPQSDSTIKRQVGIHSTRIAGVMLTKSPSASTT